MKRFVTLTIVLLFSAGFNTAGADTPPKSSAAPRSKSPAAISVEDMKNSRCGIPNIGNGPDELVNFKKGEFKSAAMPFAEMRAFATGMLDGQPAGIAEICWNTGGSGNWETIVLFRRNKGKVVCQGHYEPTNLPEGGTVVVRLAIKNNKVLMYGQVHDRKVSKPLVCSSKVFAPFNYQSK